MVRLHPFLCNQIIVCLSTVHMYYIVVYLKSILLLYQKLRKQIVIVDPTGIWVTSSRLIRYKALSKSRYIFCHCYSFALWMAVFTCLKITKIVPFETNGNCCNCRNSCGKKLVRFKNACIDMLMSRTEMKNKAGKDQRVSHSVKKMKEDGRRRFSHLIRSWPFCPGLEFARVHIPMVPLQI